MVIEFQEQDISAFDEVMEVLKRHPGFEHLRLRDEPMVSLPGLEIYPGCRKIYRDRREIRLTAKEYDLLSLLVANKGRVLTYDQIYSKVWGEDAYGDESNAIGSYIRSLREKLYKADERGGGADTAVHCRERPRGAEPGRIRKTL